MFSIATVQTLHPPAYTIKDANNQLIQGKFYGTGLTRFEQKHILTFFNYRHIALVESTKNVNGRVHYELDFERIHGHVSRKHTFPVYNTPTSTTLTLTGSWEVALSEIAWHASIQNITSGQFKYRLAVVTALKETENNESGSSHEVRKNKRKRKPYGMITMYVPPALPINEKIIEKVTNIKPGVYVRIDQIMRSICKKIFEEHADGRFPLSWKLDKSSESFNDYYEGPKQDYVFGSHIPKLDKCPWHENTK